MYNWLKRLVPINILFPHVIELITVFWAMFFWNNDVSPKKQSLKTTIIIAFFIDAIVSLLINAYCVYPLVNNIFVSHFINGILAIPISIIFLRILNNLGIFEESHINKGKIGKEELKNLLQNRKNKILIISVSIFVSLFLIVFGISSLMLNSKHSEEIERKITSIGGSLVEFKKVNPSDSPFQNNSGSANTIYKVIYEKDGKQLVAWYRAINNPGDIHQSSYRTLGEEWIIDGK